jgi:hypothetical protein
MIKQMLALLYIKPRKFVAVSLVVFCIAILKLSKRIDPEFFKLFRKEFVAMVKRID